VSDTMQAVVKEGRKRARRERRVGRMFVFRGGDRESRSVDSSKGLESCVEKRSLGGMEFLIHFEIGMARDLGCILFCAF